jgi:hypothetical protein
MFQTIDAKFWCRACHPGGRARKALGMLEMAGLLVGTVLAGCGTTETLGRSGAWPPMDSAAATSISNEGRRFSDPKAAPEAANAILRTLFGQVYDQRLPDVLVYFRAGSQPAVVLTKGGHEVHVLNQEPSIWVVLLAEGTKCLPASVSLTATGSTRPSVVTGADQLLASLVARQDLESKEIVAKAAKVEMEEAGVLAAGARLCRGMQRFPLPSDSIVRVTAGWPAKPDKTEEAATCCCCQEGRVVGKASDKETGRPEASCARGSHDENTVVDGSESQKDSGRAKANLQNTLGLDTRKAVLNFANLRRRLYWGSVGLGTPVYKFWPGRSWCIDAGGCRPSLYVFGHIFSWRLPSDVDAHPAAYLSIAPAIGLRILDPVFGNAVLGIRLGAEQALSESWLSGLTRFGLVLGVSYNFRNFSDDTTKAVKTTQTQPDGSVVETTVTTHVAEPQGNKFSAFGAIDFAF